MTDLAATEQDTAIANDPPLYDLNAWWIFSGICIIYVIFNWWIQTQVLTDQFYYYSLGAKVGADKLSTIVSDQHRMRLLTYLMVPFSLLLKMTAVTFCLLTGLLVTARKLSFRTLFKIVLFAESAFVAGILLKLLILSFGHSIDNLAEYESFAPLSLFSLFNTSSLPDWLIYPLQTIDLFQVAYFILLATGLRYFLRQPFAKMLRLVLGSYGLGLLSWMVVIAFLIISTHR